MKMQTYEQIIDELRGPYFQSLSLGRRWIAEQAAEAIRELMSEVTNKKEPDEQVINGREIITIKCSRNISNDQYDDDTPQESKLFIERYILSEATKHIRYGIVGEGRSERIEGYLRIVGGAAGL